ncbi:short chain dehydrogenase [Colletotrichum falcatum]|nr:short chain dehydrogenase [Colletotrichum falcatum]
MASILKHWNIDTVAVVLRSTIFNPGLTAPAAAAATWILESDTLGSSGLHSGLPQTCQAAWLLTAAGLALRLHEQLNKWSANNWTRDDTWDWDKEVVLITGGSGGIGASVAQQLVTRNPRTTIVVVDYVPLTWRPAPGANVRYFQCDLSDKTAIRTLCERVRREVGNPTVLVNNAGLARGFSVMDGTYTDVELTINTNLVAPFLLVKEFLPHMVKSNHGHIIHVGSMSGLIPPARIADYAATKAGLIALHEALQLELKYANRAPKVRLTLGIFGFIKTPLFGADRSGQPPFLFPLIESDTVGRCFVDTLYSGFGKTIYMPGIMRYVAMLRGGPEWLLRVAREETQKLTVDLAGYQKVNSKTGKLEVPGGRSAA